MAAFLRVTEHLDFRVRQTRAPMPAAPDDFSAFHQHRADHRIRRSRAIAAPGEPEGDAHELEIFFGHRGTRCLPQRNLIGEQKPVGYHTTTFGSRVADGVYETLLDGMELEELNLSEKIHIRHYLFLDDEFTWWVKGRSYLCRIIDMIHMGYVDEVLFGREIVERLPALVTEWSSVVRLR